jgi:hypothetical protein
MRAQLPKAQPTIFNYYCTKFFSENIPFKQWHFCDSVLAI